MAVRSIFLIGTPSIGFFTTLIELNYALAMVFISAVYLISYILIQALIMKLLFWMCCRSGTKKQCKYCGCYRWMKTVILPMGRILCMNMFPALFKKHKIRSVHSSQTTRVFMVFLDRKVENDLALVTAFCLIIYIIFALSALMFIQYFPVHVEYSEECREEDSHGRALFCYERGYNSSQPWPVDCSSYNRTETPLNCYERVFNSTMPWPVDCSSYEALHCYAIALPGFGIGIAAAFGVAKVIIIGITIFVKITEGVFTMTMKSSQKLQEWHHCRSSTCLLSKTLQICANITFISLSLAMLAIIIAATCCISLATLQNASASALIYGNLFYIIYASMAPLIFMSMVYIIIKLPFHCKQEEYTSLAKEQRPPNPLHWDVELV